MQNSGIKPLIKAFGFVAIFGLFGVPSAPLTKTVPTVGSDAVAHQSTNSHAHYIEHRGHPVYHPVETRVYRVTFWFDSDGNIIDFMEELLYVLPHPFYQQERGR